TFESSPAPYPQIFEGTTQSSELMVMILDMLLQMKGIDVNIRDYQGLSPLSLAIEALDSTLFHKLVRHPDIQINDIDFSGTTYLFKLIAMCSNSVSNLLTTPTPPPHKDTTTNSTSLLSVPSTMPVYEPTYMDIDKRYGPFNNTMGTTYSNNKMSH